MKRPLAASGAAFFLTSLCFCAFGTAASVSMGIFFFLIALLLLLFRYQGARKPLYLTLTLAVAAASARCFLAGSASEGLSGQQPDQPVAVSGEVTSMFVSPRYILLELGSAGLDSAPLPFGQRISLITFDRETASGISIGDQIQGTAQFERLEGSSMEQARQLSRGIALRGRLLSLSSSSPREYPGDRIGMTAAAALLRAKLRGDLSSALPGEMGAVAAALSFGETSGLSRTMRDRFGRAGIAHILALSGLHVTLVSAMLERFLAIFRLRRIPSILLCAAGVAGFMVLTGLSPSIQRAGIMSLLVLGARLFRRDYDALNALGFALLVQSAVNPYCAADPSLWMSAASSAALILCPPLPSEKPFPRPVRYILDNLRITSCASLGCLPVQLILGGSLSLIAPLSNLLAIPLVPWAVCGGLFTAFLGAVPFLGNMAAAVTSIATGLICGIAGILSRVPYASVPLRDGGMALWILGAAALILVSWFSRNKEHTGKACVLLIILLLETAVFTRQTALHGAALLYFHPTGCIAAAKGRDCVVIGQPQSEDDGRAVAEFLLSRNIREIQCAVFDGSLTAGGAYLARELPIGTIIARKEGGFSQYSRFSGQAYALGDMHISLSPDFGVETAARDGYFEAWILTDQIKVLTLWAEYDIMEAAIAEKPDVLLLPSRRIGNMASFPARVIVSGESAHPYNLYQCARGADIVKGGEDGAILYARGDAVKAEN